MTTQAEDKKKAGGLAGIIAADSAICSCGPGDHGLFYRGYHIEDIAKQGSFSEVAWLLTRGELPSQQELHTYQQTLRSLRELPASLKKVLEMIPKESNMTDVLRTGCSFLGNLEPEGPQHDQIAVADRLIASLSSILLYWYIWHQEGRRLDLKTDELTIAGQFLHLLQGKAPKEMHEKCLNSSLILYAEHEFNASTFTVRTIASTLSDFYSAICGGLGALRGPLHGGANEESMTLIQSFKSPAEAEQGIKALLAKKQLVMGFGHRVYTIVDPRSDVMKAWSYKLSLQAPDPQLFEIANCIQDVMWSEKKLFPNLDFYSALAYHYLNIPPAMATPIFAIARITGWAAHLLEQRAHNRLIRPLANYTGPAPKRWVPLEQR